MNIFSKLMSRAASAVGLAQPSSQAAEAAAGPAAGLAPAPMAPVQPEPAVVYTTVPMATEPPTPAKTPKVILELALHADSPPPSPPPSPKISQYERERNARIKRNEEFLESLGLGTVKLSAALEAARKQAREELGKRARRSTTGWSRSPTWRPSRRRSTWSSRVRVKRHLGLRVIIQTCSYILVEMEPATGSPRTPATDAPHRQAPQHRSTRHRATHRGVGQA
jgi:hypothetical protein